MDYNKKDIEIGIIGGSGVDIDLEDVKAVKIYTPYGAPSDLIKIGKFGDKKVAFLERHGPKHILPPHSINYRANIWAMKELGVKRIFSPCAVGGLTPKTDKGVFVVVDQYIENVPRDYFYSYRYDTKFRIGMIWLAAGDTTMAVEYLEDVAWMQGLTDYGYRMRIKQKADSVLQTINSGL